MGWHFDTHSVGLQQCQTYLHINWLAYSSGWFCLFVCFLVFLKYSHTLKGWQYSVREDTGTRVSYMLLVKYIAVNRLELELIS